MLMTTLAIKNDAINMHAKGDSHVNILRSLLWDLKAPLRWTTLGGLRNICKTRLRFKGDVIPQIRPDATRFDAEQK